MKICSKCKAEKPLTEFSKHKSAKDGLCSTCKSCARLISSNWYYQNKEKALKSRAEYRVNNAQKKKDQDKAWRENNKQRCIDNAKRWASLNAEKSKAIKRAYSDRNLETVRLRARLWAENNPEKARINHKKWRDSNKDKIRERSATWASENKDARYASCSRRRALKNKSGGSHTSLDVLKIFESQRGNCASCEVELFNSGNNKFHVDHIIPISRGGRNDKYNLQCLCPGCNLRKHAKDPIAWANENGKLL